MKSLARLFAAVLRRRWWIVAFYAALLPPAAFFAAKVQQDNSLDRLIIQSDPDYLATRAFEGVFGSGEFAIVMIEAPAPFAPEVVARLDRIEQGLAGIAAIELNSALSIFRKAKAGFEPDAEQLAAFKQFATGTDLLSKQGLLGENFLAIALVLDVHSPDQRRQTLQAIDRVIAASQAPGSEGSMRVSRLGLPYVNAYLDESQRSAPRYFGAFAVFVIVLNLGLYRSWRTLLAFLMTLGACLALSIGYIGASGGSFTIVSPMVPMTILVTVTATLVYMHSRFVDRPAGLPLDVHHVAALEHKFVACTASMFATAVGFAALMVSSILPIRQMGLWVAVGLALAWVVVFTLFPALQKILKTPTREEQPASIEWFSWLAARLPGFTYRWRWTLVFSALALAALGAVSIFGLPGLIRPMHILTNPLEYMRRHSALYRDNTRLTPKIPGTSITQIWLKGKLGSVSEPEVLTALHAFQQILEKDSEVGAAIGVTTVLRIMRYLGGKGDAWPHQPAELEELAADLETLVPNEPLLQRFVQKHSFAQTQLTVVSRALEYDSYVALERRIRAHWDEAKERSPVLQQFEMQTVGLGPLHAKMARELVPTLVESFALTVAIIFVTFLLVFRSGTARLMAMIPSLFAILMMFALMRLAGMSLNIATILIASTVLGTSENDQIHFFYHFLERRPAASVEVALRHALSTAGRAIFFATLINAGGFLAFGLADLPAVRQFGLLSAAAFVLSMIADFTALPAALWLISGEKPEGEK